MNMNEKEFGMVLIIIGILMGISLLVGFSSGYSTGQRTTDEVYIIGLPAEVLLTAEVKNVSEILRPVSYFANSICQDLGHVGGHAWYNNPVVGNKIVCFSDIKGERFEYEFTAIESKQDLLNIDIDDIYNRLEELVVYEK